MRRFLVAVGFLVILAGLAWPWLSRLPFGRLPGDFVIDRPRFRLYLPLGTSLLASVAISILLRLLRR